MTYAPSSDAELIARAKSVVMAHHHLDAQEAMDLLRRLSVRRRCPVRQVAQEVVDRRGRPAPPASPAGVRP